MHKIFSLWLLTALLISTSALAQEKVVVVPLSSTKISQQQTLTYSAFAMQQTDGDTIVIRNGCTANNSDVSAIILPLSLPLGSEIVSIKTYALDSAFSAIVFYIYLYRGSIDMGSYEVIYSDLASATGGENTSSPSSIVEFDLTPSVTETVDDKESFYLSFQSADSAVNGFCGAQVTIKLP